MVGAGVPTRTPPNVTVPGEKLRTGAIPEPARETFTACPVLVCNVKAPVSVPMEVGSKVTPMKQELLPASGKGAVGQVVEGVSSLNWPLIPTDETRSEEHTS